MKRFFAAIALLALASHARAEEINPPTLALGEKAPDWTLKGVDDKEYSLKDFDKSKFLVIVFTCNHCPTANAYEGRLKTLVDDYKDRSVALVAISPNDENSVRLDELGYTDLGDSFDEMKVRAKHIKINYPYLFEGDKTGLARKYGPTATPHAFIFDADRKLRYVGRIDDSERESNVKVHDLRNALDDLMAGRDVKTPKTNAFGCSIKWAGKAEQVKAFMAKLAKEPVAVQTASADDLKALKKNDTKKLLLVNFWATWCGPCVTEFPDLVTINRMYRNRAFEMVTVSANFPDEDVEVLRFLKAQQSSGKNLIFGSKDKYKLMEAFDPMWNASLPYTLLIAPGGEVLYKANGPVDSLELKRAIVKGLKEDRFK